MSFQPTKTDASLGLKVEEHLRRLGIHTPTIPNLQTSETLKHQRLEVIETSIRHAMIALGLDLSDDSLIDTPKRVAKMWLNELFWGLNPENFPKVTTIENKMGYNEILMEKNVRILSACEHHLVTIDGVAHVAYIPNEKVLGLSKINRICEYFARRPQVQERLTEQIGEALMFILGTDNVAVTIHAKHYCVISRGVEDQSSTTVSSFLGGAFKNDPATRKEFFDLIKL